MRDVTLFVGPTAPASPGRSLMRRGVRLQPPARRGDIERLVASSEPAVVVICDGVFESEPAVSHAEICAALDAGWLVWGVSSIGAIRAFELRHEGMQGFGYVHAQFDRFVDFTDDEMCLLHVPGPPYLALSEPLVNLRFALERKKAAFEISDESERCLLSALRELWFGERTEERIRQLMLETAGFERRCASRLLAWLRLHRVKTLDLLELMARRPWDKSCGGQREVEQIRR
jgi:hypothetical protein